MSTQSQPPDPNRESVLQIMRATRWKWADKDRAALGELEFRLIKAARQGVPVAYSELVEGLVFRIPNLNGGKPHKIDTKDWADLDRALVGDFLGLVSSKSYESHGFMLSAMAVEKDTGFPSGHFFKWMKDLGMLTDTSEEGKIRFWKKQFKQAVWANKSPHQ